MHKVNDTDELKISEMEEAEQVNNEDLIMIVQNGINKKTKAENVGIGGEATGDTLPIGATIEWHSDIIPENWLLCNGQAVSRTDYAELFNVLGTKYGTGDGSTTFNLPNLKGKVAVGKDESDTDFNELGKTGGEKEHTLTEQELPKLSGEIGVAWHKCFYENAQGIVKRRGTLTTVHELTTGQSGDKDDASTGFKVEFGGNQPHNIKQPYVVCNFIIKAKQSSGLVATVVDNLNSTSETDALSAKQGKVLKEKMEINIVTGEETKTNEFIDGKQVYAKRISFTTAQSISTWKTIGNIGVQSKIVSADLFVVISGDAYPIPCARTNELMTYYYRERTGELSMIATYEYVLGKDGYGLIKYTKNQESEE